MPTDSRPDIGEPNFGRGRGCLILLGALMVVVGVMVAIPSAICGGQTGLLLVIVLLLAVILLLVLTRV